MAWDQIPNGNQCTPEEPQNNACGKGCYPLSSTACIPCEAGFHNDNNQNTGECERCTIIPDDANWVPDITGMYADSCPWEITCNADYYWDSGTEQCKACDTDAGYHSTAQTIQGAGNESESTSCDIYEIRLVDGDDTIGTAYAKKDTGYANNLNGSWTSNGPITTPSNTNWWRRFTGYLKEEQDFTNSDGYVRSPFISADQISGPFTATAKWQYAKFNIQFNLEGSVEEPLVKYTNCTLGDEENPCLAPTADDIEESIPDGQYLAYWICNDPIGGVLHCKDGEKVFPGDPITPDIVLKSGTDFGDNYNEQFVVLEAYFTTCDAPQGKYCTEDGKYANCPQGTTTLSIGATSIANCVMVGGSNGTKFCDNQNRCFNLPEGTNISYTDFF